MKKTFYPLIFFFLSLTFSYCTTTKVFKFSKMYITRDALNTISGENELKSIFFRANNNYRFISKDKIGLTAHSNYGGTLSVKTIELSSLPKEENLPSAKIFTSYYFTAERLSQFLRDNTDPKIVYIIITPTIYEKNKNYITYELVPADINFIPLPTALMAQTAVMDPSPPAPAP